MKTRYTRLAIMLAAMLLITSSCKKETVYKDIEGFWQLQKYTTRSDGAVHPCERIYYSLQLQIVEIAEKGGTQGLPQLKGTYQYDEAAQSLTITGLYRKSGKDYLAPDASVLRQYGLNGVDTKLEVLKADGKHLVLQSDYATLTLKKF